MKTIAKTNSPVNPFIPHLAAIERHGADRAAVEQILSGYLPIQRLHLDARGHRHYGATFGQNGHQHRIQVEITEEGLSAGCIDCAERKSTSSYVPYLDNRCPYALAVLIQILVNEQAGGHVPYEACTPSAAEAPPEPALEAVRLTPTKPGAWCRSGNRVSGSTPPRSPLSKSPPISPKSPSSPANLSETRRGDEGSQ